MKLCIVTHKIIKGDGQGRANYEVVLAALRHSYQIVLVASQIAPELQKHPQVRWIQIPISRWPTQLLKDIDFANQSAAWLKKHYSEFDLVLSNGAVTWASSDVNAVHFVHTAWLNFPLHPFRIKLTINSAYQWFYSLLNARWEKQSFKQTKVLIAVSEHVKQELMQLDIPVEKVRVITNGVDLTEFCPGPANRQALGLPDSVPLALFVGDIRLNRKNLDTVLRAIQPLPALHLAVVGAVERSPYPTMARELGIANRVHFLGVRRDVATLMKAVDLFVFPSRYEPFGMVLLEAMASGLPVITAKTTGASCLVSNDSGVVLADPESVTELSQWLEKLITYPELRQRMGKHGRAIAEHQSWASKANHYITLFEDVKNME